MDMSTNNNHFNEGWEKMYTLTIDYSGSYSKSMSYFLTTLIIVEEKTGIFQH